MVDYGLVSRQINHLTSQIGGITDRNLAHEETMSRLGLASAQTGFENKNIEGQHAVELAKQKREQFLNEEVTGRQAILSAPKLSDEQKQTMIKTIEQQGHKEILDGMVYKRGSWVKALRDTIADRTKQSSTEKQQDRMYGLGLQRLNVEKQRAATAKDNRPNMQKEVEYISQIKGIPPQAALDEWISNKTLAERIRAYNNEIDSLDNDLSLMGPKGAPLKEQKIKQLRELFRIDQLPGNPAQPDIGAQKQKGGKIPPLPPVFELVQ
jgi:hypothetical protein